MTEQLEELIKLNKGIKGLKSSVEPFFSPN